MVLPDHATYRSQVLDHLGLVAGMFDALGIGDVRDHATHHNPAMRDLTGGEAVQAMVRNGLGCINQALSLVPRCFEHTPTSRLIAPRVTPAQLHDDARGRAVDTLDDSGVTARSRLRAATAAPRRGLAPTVAPRDSTSGHVDGRSHRDEPPSEPVVPLTKGSRRDHRPDLNHVLVELMVEHQAGRPVLRKPRRGQRSDGKACGHLVREPRAQWHTTYGTTSVGAERALESDTNLQKRADTPITWIPRVPAP